MCSAGSRTAAVFCIPLGFFIALNISQSDDRVGQQAESPIGFTFQETSRQHVADSPIISFIPAWRLRTLHGREHWRHYYRSVSIPSPIPYRTNNERTATGDDRSIAFVIGYKVLNAARPSRLQLARPTHLQRLISTTEEEEEVKEIAENTPTKSGIRMMKALEWKTFTHYNETDSYSTSFHPGLPANSIISLGPSCVDNNISIEISTDDTLWGRPVKGSLSNGHTLLTVLW